MVTLKVGFGVSYIHAKMTRSEWLTNMWLLVRQNVSLVDIVDQLPNHLSFGLNGGLRSILKKISIKVFD